jgi:mRNA-degrading endonuclease RelE of RelBE toxin-antitoxin system
MPAFRETRRWPEFERDLKKLCKRFRTLEEDLATLMTAQIALYHKKGIDNKGVFRVPGLPFTTPEIYKVKKFACRALKGRGANSGLRLIYGYFREEDRIDLIEIYFKGDQENEDRERILANYGEKKGPRG